MIESDRYTHQAFHSPFQTPVDSWPDRDHDAEMDRLSVPYAGQTRMRLTIASGMADAIVRIDPEAIDLISIDCCARLAPRLRVSGSELRVSWPATLGAWLRAVVAAECRDVEIVLHPAVEWTFLVRGGLSRFEADLTGGKLARLDIGGGISNALIDLPAPAGPVPIRISGGVSNFGLRRPAAAGVHLAISGGVSKLRLDDQVLGAIGGGTRLSTGGVAGDISRYAVEISGGASRLEIVAR
jgi:hypothetical protein